MGSKNCECVSEAAGRSAAALRQSCVLSLREIKASMQGVSWPDCAIHLLTQLTVAHEDETGTVLHSLPVMVIIMHTQTYRCPLSRERIHYKRIWLCEYPLQESSGITALLHKYEIELHCPKLHNLHELLQPQASRDTVTLTVSHLQPAEMFNPQDLLVGPNYYYTVL